MGERQIPFHLLNKDELIYEIEIRDEIPVDNISGLRSQIKHLDAKMPTDEIISCDRDWLDELNIVTLKLDELCSLIDAKPISLKNINRIYALSCHLFHRLGRIQITPGHDTEVERFNQCNVKLKSIISKVENLKSSFNDSQTSNETVLPNISESQSVVDITCDRYKAVHTLGIKFNGKSCILVFLNRLEELCISRGVSESKLFTSASDLFSDEAYSWYQANKHSVSSWASLKSLLINDYLPVDFDHRLLKEIESRTQGSDEGIVNYLCIMQNYFNRLRRPLDERRKLEIVKYNIRPFYTTQLALTSINTWAELKNNCRLLENAKQRADAFVEPPRCSSAALAGDLAYKYPAKSFKQCSSVDKDFCVQCRVKGHCLSNCEKPHVLVCYRCGEPGYTSRTCPKCNIPVTPSNIPKNA